MSRVESLTDAQWAQVRRLRGEWLAVGLSTEPCDRPRAEAAVTAMYTAVGRAAPQFVWTDTASGNSATWPRASRTEP